MLLFSNEQINVIYNKSIKVHRIWTQYKMIAWQAIIQFITKVITIFPLTHFFFIFLTVAMAKRSDERRLQESTNIITKNPKTEWVCLTHPNMAISTSFQQMPSQIIITQQKTNITTHHISQNPIPTKFKRERSPPKPGFSKSHSQPRTSRPRKCSPFTIWGRNEHQRLKLCVELQW